MNTLPRHENQSEVNHLSEIATKRGLDPMTDIGELVHDVADHYGTEAANSADSEDEADEIIDAYSCMGSDVNNDGLGAQISVLIAFHGLADAHKLIESSQPFVF